MAGIQIMEKIKKILIFTDPNIEAKIMKGVLPKFFYGIYFQINKWRLKIILKEFSKDKIVVISQYDKLLNKLSYKDSRQKTWHAARNWYKLLPNWQKVLNCRGILLPQIWETRIAMFLSGQVFAYDAVIKEIIRKEKPDKIIILDKYSILEKIALYQSQKLKIPHTTIGFDISIFDFWLKKFLRKRETHLKKRKIFQTVENRVPLSNAIASSNGTLKSKILLCGSHKLHFRSLNILGEEIKKEGKLLPILIYDSIVDSDYLHKNINNINIFSLIEKDKMETLFKNNHQKISHWWQKNKKNLSKFPYFLLKNYYIEGYLDLLTIQSLYLQAAEILIKKIEPQAIIFVSDARFLERSLSLIAKKHKISRILSSPNMIIDKILVNNYDTGDIICVSGKNIKRELIKIGIDKEKIFITGDPRYDNIPQKIKSLHKEAICQKYHLSLNKKKILLLSLYSSNFIPVEEKKLFFQSSYAALQKIKNTELIIKPHPNESLDLLEEQIKQWKIKNATIISGDLYELLFVSDLVLMIWSMAGFEAQIMKKPVIAVNFLNKNYNDYIPYGEKGGGIEIKKPENLYPAIKKLLEDKVFREKLIKNGEKFYQFYIRQPDGRAAQRIIGITKRI